MLGIEVASSTDAALSHTEIRIELGDSAASADPPSIALEGDSFDVSRGGESIVIRAGTERGLIHATSNLLEKLGAQFPPGVAPSYPRIEPGRLAALEPWHVTPAFKRRAFISDIMTWNYSHPGPSRIASAPRPRIHPVDGAARASTRSRTFGTRTTRGSRSTKSRRFCASTGSASSTAGTCCKSCCRAIAFGEHPEYFPAADDGVRAARGNLCVSNPDAVALVRQGALAYVRDHPENELLHIWGADVRRGAWCRCGQCRELPPQIQYMEVVNAIAAELATEPKAPPIAYLAYHDTIEPHPGLKPRDNVWFEWAPRERCYSHAIDDAACEINPRYLESLKRYIDIFKGRGHIFEYYADAILFGGLGFATPSIVAHDLRAYQRLGITSVSCLTFGAYSVMAYPVNLEAFVRGAQNPDFDPDATLLETAAGRHPRCSSEMAAAYRAVERASKLCLDYADVMSPVMPPEKAARKLNELREAALTFNEAIAAADQIASSADTRLADAEKELWRYSSDVLAGMSDYLGALQQTGVHRQIWGAAAITRVTDAIGHIRSIDPEIKGTWGAYDLEWIREMWLRALQRGLDGIGKPSEELF